MSNLKFGIGDKIKLLDGDNIYEIIGTGGGNYELLCLEYYAPEDLGDDVKLFGYNQTVWISGFFEYLFKLAK